MDSVLRLNSISPDLADLFKAVDEPRQRRAVKAACIEAAAQTELRSPDVERAIESLDKKKGNLADIKQRIFSLSEALDEEYFDLQESNPGDVKALARFRQARAASALVFGLSSHRDDLSEAIYEAIVAAARQSDVIRKIEIALMENPKRIP